MPSIKRLNSVSYCIAQHAVSGLSYIHPYIGYACKELGLTSIKVNLCQNDPCPEQFKSNKPLHLSLIALRKKFEGILESEGFTVNDIKDISLLFELTKDLSDYSSTNCHVCLTTKSGKIFLHGVNYLGDPMQPNKDVCQELP